MFPNAASWKWMNFLFGSIFHLPRWHIKRLQRGDICFAWRGCSLQFFDARLFGWLVELPVAFCSCFISTVVWLRQGYQATRIFANFIFLCLVTVLIQRNNKVQPYPSKQWSSERTQMLRKIVVLTSHNVKGSTHARSTDSWKSLFDPYL